MLKFTNKNFINNINNINKLYLKDKSLILYIILATLLFIENTIFFFDKEYKYNIFTILSLFTIYLYFNSIKFAIIIAILIINIYYLLYKNIYESFDEDAANTACANLTGIIENQYNDQADQKYYEYCELSGLRKSLYKNPTGNLTINGGVMYPYNAHGSGINHYENLEDEIDKSKIGGTEVDYHRHDLSFRQWMIYNYELTPKDNNTFMRYGTFANEDIKYGDTNIISLTDAYIKNLQQRDVINCTSENVNIPDNKDILIKAWEDYEINNGTDTEVPDSE